MSIGEWSQLRRPPVTPHKCSVPVRYSTGCGHTGDAGSVIRALIVTAQSNYMMSTSIRCTNSYRSPRNIGPNIWIADILPPVFEE